MIRLYRPKYLLCVTLATFVACDGADNLLTPNNSPQTAGLSASLSARAARGGPPTHAPTDSIWKNSSSGVTPLIACTSTDPELTVSCSQPGWNTYAGLYSGSLPVTVTLTNVNIYHETYNMTCTGFGIITGCTPGSYSPWTPNSSGTTTYPFNITMTGAAGSGGIDVTFTKTTDGTKHSSGTVTLNAAWWKKVTVAPHTASVVTSVNKDTSYQFTVTNGGMFATAYQFTAACTGMTTCLVNPSYKFTAPFTSTGVLPAGSTGHVSVIFHTTATTPATVKFVARDTSTTPCCVTWPAILADSGIVTVTH
jgi:hypothetical protein